MDSKYDAAIVYVIGMACYFAGWLGGYFYD